MVILYRKRFGPRAARLSALEVLGIPPEDLRGDPLFGGRPNARYFFAVFLAGAFLAGAFLAGAAFFAGAFFAGAFFAAFFAAIVFLLGKSWKKRNDKLAAR